MNHTRRSFLQLASLFLCLSAFSPASCTGDTQSKVAITLLGTTDLHGNILPIDYYANRPVDRGLAKIATLVRQVRSEQSNVLLLDSGDTIQGTPLAFYFARKDTSRPNPTVAVMNALGYDAMALGNHEFNFGLEPMWKAKREANFPWLAANVRQTYTEGPGHFEPYIIKDVAGVRIGIVGFVTPGIPRWEVPANYRGYEFDDIVETAKRVIPPLRKKVDLLVVIAHSGMERGAGSQAEQFPTIPRENTIVELAEQVPEIDVILMGHTHREIPETIINGVLLVQAKNWGQSLARADIVMERDAKGHWRLASKRSTTIPITDSVPPDPEVLALATPYHEATQKYLDTPVATSPREMDGSTARYEDHPFVDLIHKVQMEYGKADVSMATMLFAGARVPAGEVTVRQIAAIYIYENTLYTVEMTGAQLREILEHAATFYSSWPVPAGERIRLPGYSADCAEGVDYVIDVTQPAGHRIRDLKYKGNPLDPRQKLRVATNNYRYAGGGQYATYKGLPIVYQSPQEIRELMIEYVARTGVIPVAADGNWKIVPQEAVDAMIHAGRERTRPQAASAAAAP